MAEAQIMKKREIIPVIRYQSDDSLIKSSKRSKRVYKHKDTFRTKDQLRAEISSLTSQL